MTLIEQHQDRLALYLAAEVAILKGQSYRIGDRQLTRADLTAVQSEIRRLNGEINTLSAARNRRRMYFGVPLG